MLKVAIVGNIASGKSTVENFIKDFGYEVYDADKIAHKILETSSEIQSVFKNDDVFEDNKISRKKMGELVFSNKEKLHLLESIIHPEVKKAFEKIFESNLGIVFISVPQLFESKMDSLFDVIIFVSAPQNIRLERLIKRNNLAEEEAIKRINSQADEEEKINNSDFVIYNNSDLEYLKTQTDNIIKKIISNYNL